MGFLDFFKRKNNEVSIPENIPEELKNITELLNEVRLKGKLSIKLPNEVIDNLKIIGNTKNWYKEIDEETIQTLNRIYRKWQNALIVKEKPKEQTIHKLGESGGFEEPKTEDYAYTGVSYMVDEETGEFYLAENETIIDPIFDEISLNDNYKKVTVQFLNDIKLKWSKIRDENLSYIQQHEFDKIQIIQFDNMEAYEVYENYFYLLGLFKELYPFRDNKKCLKILSTISAFLYANLDIIKEKLRIYQFLWLKAYKPEKSDKELLEETNIQFNKINFGHIEDNYKKVLFYKEKYGL